jgi:hypothetical protein
MRTRCLHAISMLAVSCVLASIFESPAHGQIQDAGLWLGTFSQGQFNPKGLEDARTRWWFDGNARFLGDDFELFQGVVRPGLGYQLTEEQTAWMGYAWIGESLPDLTFHENRIWEQWSLARDHGDVTIQLRSRLEQRFVSLGDDVGWRYRQMVRLQKPIDRYPNLLWVAWDEVFFHLNDTDWGARTGYNQNRLFVGIGRTPPLRSSRRTEIGYLYQQIQVAEDGADLSNHILSINFFFSP